MEASLDRLDAIDCREAPESRRFRYDYVDNAQIGNIIAFRRLGSSVKSARIIKKSTKDRKFLVQMKYGAKLLIDFDDVVWVKTIDWWPKWVYNLLKGIEESDEA